MEIHFLEQHNNILTSLTLLHLLDLFLVPQPNSSSPLPGTDLRNNRTVCAGTTFTAAAATAGTDPSYRCYQRFAGIASPESHG